MVSPFLALFRGRKVQDFFARLRAAPADDAPRREIARLLVRSGYVARAALIKAQLELAGCPENDPVRPALVELERNLLAEHGAAWRREELPELPGIVWGEFKRGFPAALDVADPEVLIHLGADLRASAPLERIQVRHLKLPLLRVLLKTPHLAGVTEIDLSDNVLGLAGAHALATVPADAGWRRLNLRNTALGPLGLQALAAAPIMPSLETLDVSANALGKDGPEFRCAMGLRELNLGENEARRRCAAIAGSRVRPAAAH